jgi:hemin uptake protein HemP
MMASGEATASSRPEESAQVPGRRAVGSDELFQGHWELIIVHRNEEYRLRITRAGKLILTK